MKILSFALTQYSQDPMNFSFYPDKLENLYRYYQAKPNRVRDFSTLFETDLSGFISRPICPSAGIDTYSYSYLPFSTARFHDSFAITCSGHYHYSTPIDFPRLIQIYGMEMLLLESPEDIPHAGYFLHAKRSLMIPSEHKKAAYIDWKSSNITIGGISLGMKRERVQDILVTVQPVAEKPDRLGFYPSARDHEKKFFRLQGFPEECRSVHIW